MTIIRAATIDTAIDETRKQAKQTIQQLVNWHHSRIAEIDGGHRYYRRGEDITDQMRKRHEHEIVMCTTVLEAVDHMKAGDVKRAADLCSQIKEHLPNVQ